MPLSDREEQLLKEMEGALNSSTPIPARHHGTGGITLLAAGFILLIAGAITPIVIVGVLGYVTMLGGAILYYQSRSADSVKGRLNARIQRAAQERRELRRPKP